MWNVVNCIMFNSAHEVLLLTLRKALSQISSSKSSPNSTAQSALIFASDEFLKEVIWLNKSYFIEQQKNNIAKRWISSLVQSLYAWIFLLSCTTGLSMQCPLLKGLTSVLQIENPRGRFSERTFGTVHCSIFHCFCFLLLIFKFNVSLDYFSLKKFFK